MDDSGSKDGIDIGSDTLGRSVGLMTKASLKQKS